MAQDRLEAEFETLLHRLTPSADLLTLAEATFRDLWNDRLAQGRKIAAEMSRSPTQLDRKIE